MSLCKEQSQITLFKSPLNSIPESTFAHLKFEAVSLVEGFGVGFSGDGGWFSCGKGGQNSRTKNQPKDLDSVDLLQGSFGPLGPKVGKRVRK